MGWSKDPGPTYDGGQTDPPFSFYGAFIGQLSIFVDESGDFGEYSTHSPYYIITMIFHDQNKDIQQNINHLNESLENRILNSVLFTELSKYDVRKVSPKDYKLFQVADLICTLQLLDIKHKKNELSKSELLIFHNPKDLKKQFLKPIKKKEFTGLK